MAKLYRQVLRNAWLRRAIQEVTGIPVEPTLRYRTLVRTTERFRADDMATDTYMLYALGTYAFNNGQSLDFCQIFLVKNHAIAECIRFELTPPCKT
jgi:hypothetical protein